MSDIDPKSEDLTPEGETPETDVVVEGIEDVQSGETDAAEAPVVVEIAEDAPPTPEERIAQLEAALADAHRNRLLALAEGENAGKRADKRIADNAKYATSNICKAILQVADNLERALLAAPEDKRANNDLVKNLAVGVELTGKELETVLEGQGVKKFVSLDQPFDANHHQAMQEVERTDVPTGTIVQVVQEGYMMADRLLRPAMVVIAKGGPKRETLAAEVTDENASVDTSA